MLVNFEPEVLIAACLSSFVNMILNIIKSPKKGPDRMATPTDATRERNLVTDNEFDSRVT